MFGTFEEDMAIQTYEYFHNPTFGHHMVVRGINADTEEAYPDGSVWDCLDMDFYDDIGPQAAIFIPTKPGLIWGRMELLEDQAILVQAGTRYFIQSHYINVTDEKLYLRDVLHFGTIPIEQVQRPVGTWTMTSDNFLLAANGELAESDECTFEGETFISSLMVHMHHNGVGFESSSVGPRGDESYLYDLSYWRNDWRYNFQIQNYEPGLHVPEGHPVRYSCLFENETDRDLIWPEEMCVFEGLAYPLLRPYACNNGLDVSGDVFPEFEFR